jgi:hypothetical protein
LVEFLADIGRIDLAQLNRDWLSRWTKSLAKEIGKRKVQKRVGDDDIYSFIFGYFEMLLRQDVFKECIMIYREPN